MEGLDERVGGNEGVGEEVERGQYWGVGVDGTGCSWCGTGGWGIPCALSALCIHVVVYSSCIQILCNACNTSPLFVLFHLRWRLLFRCQLKGLRRVGGALRISVTHTSTSLWLGIPNVQIPLFEPSSLHANLLCFCPLSIPHFRQSTDIIVSQHQLRRL